MLILSRITSDYLFFQVSDAVFSIHITLAHATDRPTFVLSPMIFHSKSAKAPKIANSYFPIVEVVSTLSCSRTSGFSIENKWNSLRVEISNRKQCDQSTAYYAALPSTSNFALRPSNFPSPRISYPTTCIAQPR